MQRGRFVVSFLVIVPWLLMPAETLSAGDIPVKSTQTAQFDCPISAQRIHGHIRFLASPELKGRSGEGARLAAEYICRQWQQDGLRPLFANRSYFQEIPGRSENDDGSKPILGRNVGAWIPGSDPALRNEFVIVSAHYDHLGVRNGQIYRGADDNASGVAMLLEVSRYFAETPAKPRRSLVFVAFDLEERMLWGSRWFAAHPPWPLERVKLFITADMIGRSLGDLPLPVVFVLGSEHAPELKQVLDGVESPRPLRHPLLANLADDATDGGCPLEVARLGIDLIGTRSDYGPFRDRKVPFLFFSTGEHPDYHTPRDVPERVDDEQVAWVSALVLDVSQRVADTESPPHWTDEVHTDLDEIRTLNRITSLLLKVDGDRKLTSLQRLLVSRTQTETQEILNRGTMTPDERTWLMGMSQLILLTVF